jgi:propionate catabolism operon transcriptional regulator
LLAQGIHSASARRAQPFVAVNCAAFPDSLLESELFGYVEGAFTGSSRGGKVGLVEAAHTGTLFLDEIGEMPLPLQTRLLRVLQEKEVLRIGAIEPTPVDVRVIAATHRDLAAQVKEGVFRQDLFYRLNILVLRLPPLRLRTQDLPELVEHLLAKVAQRLGGAVTLNPDWLTELLELGRHYTWPGNIRELENLIERLMVLGTVQGDQAVVLEDIAPELRAVVAEPAMPALRDQQERSEQEHLAKVLEECGGNRALAAQQLGISRSTLWRKLRKG